MRGQAAKTATPPLTPPATPRCQLGEKLCLKMGSFAFRRPTG